MANTYLRIKTQKERFPESSEEISLTAFSDKDLRGGLQITLGKEYAILGEYKAILLAEAILARYGMSPDHTFITATGNETIESRYNIVYQEREND